jgi:hypothetical protein
VKRTPVHVAPSLRDRVVIIREGRDKGLYYCPDPYCLCHFDHSDCPEERGCWLHTGKMSKSLAEKK